MPVQPDLLARGERPSLRDLGLAVQASLYTESLSAFAKAAWHVMEPQANLKWGWALEAICDHLEAVTDGRIKRLLMNVPPGCMKSMLTGVIWPAWVWTKPEMRARRFLGTSHKQDLALRDNLKCRRLITSRWYQERWPVLLVSDQNAKGKFENAETGFREAMAFTSMTGSRGDFVILDDPLSVDDANSEAALLSAELTFTEALPTRVNNEDSAIVVIMQRLADRDTSGIILERDLGYTHLCLPMEFEVNRRCSTSIGFIDPRTTEGELLFPERFPRKQVDELARVLGSYAYSGQMQQNPKPRGGGMFKEKHVHLWPCERSLPDFSFVIKSYDTAYTENTCNDPTACTVWGIFHEAGRGVGMMLLDAWDEHLEYADLRRRIIGDWRAVYGAHKGAQQHVHTGRRADACLVENKGSGIALLQDLRRAKVPAVSYNPGKADKYGRASVTLPAFEMDIIYVPESKYDRGQAVTWARPFFKQLHKFGPRTADHDDYVDTFTQAVIYLRDAGLLVLDAVEDDEEEVAEYSRSRRGGTYG